MRCSTASRRMHLLYYGELPREQHEALQAHLRDCPDCAGEYARMRTMMRELSLAAVEPGDSAEEETWSRIRSGLSRPPERHHLTRLAAAFVIFTIGLGAGLWLSRRLATSSPAPPPEVAVSRSEWNRYLADLELLLLDAGNSREPAPANHSLTGRAVAAERLLFQSRYLSRDNLSSPEARNLLEETALLLQEIRNRPESFQRDPGWIQRIIRDRRMLERIRFLLRNNVPESHLEVERAPVI